MTDREITLGARAVEVGFISAEELCVALRELWTDPSAPAHLWQILVRDSLIDMEQAETLERLVDGARPVETAKFIPEPGRRYEFEKRLGAGGMGIVRQMRDKTLGRSVAMKQLDADAARVDEHVGTLLAEARAAGMLEHPNIMPIYDSGMLETGEPYYTMRLMDSMSLDDVLNLLRTGNPEAEREYPLVRLLRIFQQVCMAVDYAHTRGVVHRDLKPDNIRLGRYGEVQLADWGLARVEGLPDLPLRKALQDAADRGEEDPCIVIGSPNYMSPEQARGENDRTGPHSDIWSLGAILYEMLTLHAPFEDNDTMILLDRVERDDVVPPRTQAPDRRIPQDLEDLCMSCLEKDMDARVHDVRILWRGLEDHIEGRRKREVRDQGAFEQIQRGQRFSEAYTRLRGARDRLAGRIDDVPETVQVALRRELEALRLEMVTVWGEAWDAWTRVLGYSESDLVARAKLAEMAMDRLQDCEAEGDELGCQFFWGHLNRCNDGAWDAYLTGSSSLRVESHPAGATVHLRSFAEPSLDKMAAEARALGRTPLELDDLPAGLYQVSLELAGCKTVSKPLFLRANSGRSLRVALS